jgi:hypothetical protein
MKLHGTARERITMITKVPFACAPPTGSVLELCERHIQCEGARQREKPELSSGQCPIYDYLVKLSRLNHLERHVDKSRSCHRLLRGGDRILSAGSFSLNVKFTSDQFLISAAEFASKGCKVYATARKLEKVQALHHPQIELLPLDVTDNSAVKVVVDTIITNEGKIDIVVNNAGVGCYGM